MKIRNVATTLIAIFTCLLATKIPAKAFFGVSPLVGSWDCEQTIRDSNGHYTIEYNITYSRNNTSYSIGSLTVRSKDLESPLMYTLSSKGEWRFRSGNILEEKGSNVRVINVTSIPGATYQQDAAFRAEIDRMFPFQQMFEDAITQGVYSQIEFSNNNNRFKTIIEGERDWTDAAICNRS